MRSSLIRIEGRGDQDPTMKNRETQRPLKVKKTEERVVFQKKNETLSVLGEKWSATNSLTRGDAFKSLARWRSG